STKPTRTRSSEPITCRREAYVKALCSGAMSAPRKSYITPDGAKKLRAELDQLWTIERPRVTQEVADAAAQGDRSENAEYIYGKRRLREIDRRVRFLSKRLEEVSVVTEKPSDPDRAFFGARVTVTD